MQAHPPAIPSLAIVNARVFTGDPRRPWGDAVLVLGEVIELVGSSAEVRKRAGPAARVVDARRMLLARAPADWLRARPIARGEPAAFILVRDDLSPVTAEGLRAARVALEVVAGRIVREDLP